MAPILIVLGLLALGVAIVAWATRSRPDRLATPRHEQDVAWNDPMTPAVAPPADAAPIDDPFADAPPLDVHQEHHP